MDMCDTFNAEVSPTIVLLDVQGRRSPVATGDRAETALVLADALQELGGSGRTIEIPAGDDEFPDGQPILLFYRSNRGRPTKGEIMRTARIIARSEIREHDCRLVDGKTLYVTGSRAVVYPENAPAVPGSVVFLVSGRIWFNANRSTVNFPTGAVQRGLFLKDISARLTEGEVSFAR